MCHLEIASFEANLSAFTFQILYFPTQNLPICRSGTPPPKTLAYLEGLINNVFTQQPVPTCETTVECFHVTPSLLGTQERTENGHHVGVQEDCSFCGNLGMGRCTCQQCVEWHCYLSGNSCLNTYLWCSTIEYCTHCAQRRQLEIRVQQSHMMKKLYSVRSSYS